MDFKTYSNIYDYDRLLDENIHTELFTNLTDVEIIDEKHNFIAFLNGFTHVILSSRTLP